LASIIPPTLAVEKVSFSFPKYAFPAGKIRKSHIYLIYGECCTQEAKNALKSRHMPFCEQNKKIEKKSINLSKLTISDVILRDP
jgi:hypothetical protein